MTLAAIGLGSNLGDRRHHLRAAVAGLARLGRVAAVSSLYETAPVGPVPQGPFLNAVVVLDTALEPPALLAGLLDLEQAAHRERLERWGPRTLDLDLLLYGDRVVALPGLSVPHPHLTERRFALEPLLEVWPRVRLPDGTPLAPLLAGLLDQEARIVEGPE